MTRKNPRLEIHCNALQKIRVAVKPIKMILRTRIERFSPRSSGMVSLPTSRSPCMSRISKNAVLTNTIPTAHRATITLTQPMVPDMDNGGRTAVTIPQATAIRSVFEPGISLILRYLMTGSHSGTSFRLYESPKRLMINRAKNGNWPIL